MESNMRLDETRETDVGRWKLFFRCRIFSVKINSRKDFMDVYFGKLISACFLSC